MPSQVLILYNEPKTIVPPDDHPELDSGESVLDEVYVVADALDRLGIPYRVAGVERLSQAGRLLAASPEPVVFNIVEGSDEWLWDAVLVPALCESLGKGCTGSDTPCLVTTLDKWQTKLLLMAAGLRCPIGTVVPVGGRVRRAALASGPYIVKPLRLDASEGIDLHSVIERPGPALTRAVKAIHRQFKQPALIEQFVGRRELNISLLQCGDRVEILPLAEIDFSAFPADRPRVVGYSAKWLPETFDYENTPRIIPAPLPRKVAAEVRRAALTAWHVLGCRDFVRVDMRLDEENRPVILEVNPNPDISPDGGFIAAVEASGRKYEDFVHAVVGNAAQRLAGLGPPMQIGEPAAGAAARKPKRRRKTARKGRIRRTVRADREPILRLVKETGFFHDNELEVAREVLDEALDNGPDGHYQSYCFERRKQVLGWICFGPTPCTEGTFDIYWIAVARQYQGEGIGHRLSEFVEKLMLKRGGRLAVVETAGRAAYLPSRRFYVGLGYREASRVLDFYDWEDDKVIYTKELE